MTTKKPETPASESVGIDPEDLKVQPHHQSSVIDDESKKLIDSLLDRAHVFGNLAFVLRQALENVLNKIKAAGYQHNDAKAIYSVASSIADNYLKEINDLNALKEILAKESSQKLH